MTMYPLKLDIYQGIYLMTPNKTNNPRIIPTKKENQSSSIVNLTGFFSFSKIILSDDFGYYRKSYFKLSNRKFIKLSIPHNLC
jgi:hypothetical protein